MNNWSTNTIRLEKNADQYAIWKLEQSINFGLNGTQLSEKEVKKYWESLQIDPYKKAFLELLIWPNQS